MIDRCERAGAQRYRIIKRGASVAADCQPAGARGVYKVIGPQRPCKLPRRRRRRRPNVAIGSGKLVYARPIPSPVGRSPDTAIFKLAVAPRDGNHRNVVPEIRTGKLRGLKSPIAIAERDVDSGVSEANNVRAAIPPQAGQQAQVLLHMPTSGFVTEVRDHGLWLEGESSVAVAERNVDAGVSEADDVRAAVAGQVGQEARVLLYTPCSGYVTEVRDHELRVLKSSVAVAERDVDPAISESDNVRAAVARKVGEEARVLVYMPTPGLITEVLDDELRVLKSSVPVAKRDVDSGVSEANDVRAAIPPHIGQEARVLLHTPTPGLITEVLDDEMRVLKSSVPVAKRDVDPGVSEADNVRAAIAPQVGQESRVLLYMPTPGFITEIRDHELRVLKRSIAVTNRDVDSGVSEADDVRSAIPPHIGQEARVLLHTPFSRLVSEVGENHLWRLKRAVAFAERGPHPALSEPDYVGAPTAGKVGEKARVPLDKPTPGIR